MEPANDCFSDYTRAERIADLCIHLVGVSAGILGVGVLLILGLRDATVSVAVALVIYAAGLLAMLCFSALYHAVEHPTRKQVLRRFDHAAIFIMIAGTYTPFALARIGGTLGIGLLAFVWAIAVVGVVLKLFRPRSSHGLAMVLYLVMGWCAVVAIQPLFEAIGTAMAVLVLLGGGFYTIGVPFHLWRSLRFHNAIWHGCVLVGASFHYAAVLGSVALTGA